MTQEEYKRLNDYLNDLFLEFQKKNKIFVDNLIPIWNLSIIINNYFKNNIETFQIKSKSNHLTFDDVYLLAREIIEKISPRYLDEYDELIKSGALNFNFNSKGNSEFSFNYYNEIVNRKLINVSREFNYTDVVFLIHEFFHYTQVKMNKKISYNFEFFTEFIAIYFETIAKRYLIEEKNISKDELIINNRVESLYRNNIKLYQYITVLVAYEYLGNINENTEEDLRNILRIRDPSFQKECLQTLNKLDSLKKNKSAVTLFNQNYRYVVGTILAYYALEHSKLEDMVELNDKINTEYAELSVQEVLNKVGIPLNQNMVLESLDIIKKSISDPVLRKTK